MISDMYKITYLLFYSFCVTYLMLNMWHWLLRPFSRDQFPIITFDKYYRYDEIQDYLNQLEKKYPKLVTLENYGLSYEKRKLTAVYISRDKKKSKPIIFVDAGIHAREWISPAQGLYVLNQILQNPQNSYLTDDVDWIIVPLLNPDGYEYSHTNDRRWRKTRSLGVKCDGVDPNRNFDYHWGGIGSSRNECSNIYAGPAAFSEPETLALGKLISKYAFETKLYLTFHSPAQLFLHPWGCMQGSPPNVKELTSVAREAIKAVKAVNGTVYKIGSSAKLLAYASGSSRDWAYGVAGIPLAYTMELPASGTSNSFDIPPEKIYGIVLEMFEGIKVFHKYIAKQFGNLHG